MTETAANAAPTSKVDFSAVARDIAARAVKTADERVEALHASAEKATATLEASLGTASTTLGEVSRNIQSAIYADAKAALAAIEKIASAKSFAEAAGIHVQYLSERSQIGLARMAKANEYLAKALQDGANGAQGVIAKMAAKNQAA